CLLAAQLWSARNFSPIFLLSLTSAPFQSRTWTAWKWRLSAIGSRNERKKASILTLPIQAIACLLSGYLSSYEASLFAILHSISSDGWLLWVYSILHESSCLPMPSNCPLQQGFSIAYLIISGTHSWPCALTHSFISKKSNEVPRRLVDIGFLILRLVGNSTGSGHRLQPP